MCFCFAGPQEGAGKNTGEVKIELERHPHLVVPRNRTPVALGVTLRTPREFPMDPGGREYRWASYGVNDLGDEVEEVDYMSQFNKRFNKVRAIMLIFMSVYTIIVCFVMFFNIFSPCVRLVQLFLIQSQSLQLICRLRHGNLELD